MKIYISLIIFIGISALIFYIDHNLNASISIASPLQREINDVVFQKIRKEVLDVASTAEINKKGKHFRLYVFVYGISDPSTQERIISSLSSTIHGVCKYGVAVGFYKKGDIDSDGDVCLMQRVIY